MLTIREEVALTGRSETAVREVRAADLAARAWERAQLAVLEPDGQPTEVQYGSPEWAALPADDLRRTAAMLRAAAAWRSYRADTAERIVWQVEADLIAGEIAREEHRAEWDAEQADSWAEIAHWAKGLADVRTPEEFKAARAASRPREVRAAEGWPPVAIPGRPGSWRHLIDGQQVDLSTRDRLETAA